jgi:heparan-alpha-glucosaminide N-acetyltransferase
MAATAAVPAPVSTTTATPAPLAAPIKRVPSIDAFRGLVMFLMLAEVMRLWTLHDAFPSSWFWSIVAFNTQHVDWQWLSLHDLIQPAFSFLAGASLPFSIASRMGKGESFGKMLVHAIRRSLILIFLGIFLRSMGSHQTYWTFEDTLTQIGLGYTLLFLLGFASRRVQVIVFAAILVLFWAAFVIYPAPPANFDYAAVGVPADFPYIYTSGLFAHFNKNANLAWAFDTWFLNLFPRESPFVYNEGGWSTLSFIPTLATMMMGMWTGAFLKSARTTGEKLKGLLVWGMASTVAGLLLQWLQICPIVKRIWTSSYTLFSGGLVLLMLAGFYAAIDFKGWKRWSFPLLVIGANSIAIYVMAWTMESFVQRSLQIHFGSAPFLVLGAPFEPVLRGIAVLLVFWSILYWMYRKAIFIKI